MPGESKRLILNSGGILSGSGGACEDPVLEIKMPWTLLNENNLGKESDVLSILADANILNDFDSKYTDLVSMRH